MSITGIRFHSGTSIPLKVAGLIVGLASTVFGPLEAAVISAKSVSFSDVSSAISSASEGDTVLVPEGTAGWISSLAITKGITLQGAGNDKTVVLDDMPRPERKKRPPGQPQRDKLEQRPRERSEQHQAQWTKQGRHWPGSRSGPNREGRQGGANPGIMAVDLTSGQKFRLTGFTFRYGSIATKGSGGCVRLSGTCFAVRVDHCHFDQLYQTAIFVQGWIYGVIDHNRWDQRADIGSVAAIRTNNCETYAESKFGDGSWAAPTNFGSANFLFIEDNTFNNLGTVQTAGGIDSQYGARYVSRHNHYFNCVMITGHGTESGGRVRGQRAIEFYDNTYKGTVPQSIGLTRSGVTIYHDNSWIGPVKSQHIPLTVFRCDFPYRTFGGASGSNPWDVNDTEGNGTNVPDHSPHLYASGKHTGPIASGTVVSAGAGWKPDQWVGYMLTNTTQAINAGQNYVSRILSNTSDTITFARETPDPIPSSPAGKTFNPGDGFAIYKLLIALDQPSRGQCDLLAGNPPINSVTGRAVWPHQKLEPIYGWENKVNGSLISVGSAYPTLQENRDYYNQTSTFNGKVGVGVGALADRPKNCVPGVAYWATDQGEWDSTHSGPDGQLYVCTTTNTWLLSYKPYTYPHPLVSGTPPHP